MPDTSKMSPESYAAFIGKKSYPAGQPRRILSEPISDQEIAVEAKTLSDQVFDKLNDRLAKSQGESMSEQFKPGQTVWMKNSGFACEFIAERSGRAFVLSKETEVVGLVDLVSLTATDPNAKPLPQACPFCGGPSATKSYGTSSYLVCCSLNEPCLVGPHKPTREEAVAVWNIIRVIQPGEFTNDLRDALRKAADDCKFKTTLKE